MNSIVQIIGKVECNLQRLLEYFPVNYPLQEYLRVWGETRLDIQSRLKILDVLEYILPMLFIR